MIRFSPRKASLLAAIAAASLTAVANASPVFTQLAPPVGLAVGQPYYYVVITDITGDATSPLASTYDAIAAADTSTLQYYGTPITFQALVSTADGTTANVRFNPAAGDGIYLINNTKVANDGADFWDGTHLAPISLSPTGNTVTGPGVWTGSGYFGDPGIFLSGPTSSVLGNTDSGMASAGDPTSTSIGWSQSAWGPETLDSLHYYAVSQELFAPEPSTIALLGLAGTMILRRRGVRASRR